MPRKKTARTGLTVRCTECGGATRVLATRQPERLRDIPRHKPPAGTVLVRQRRCQKCMHKFTTWEVA